jgi:hypothetical protein
MSPYIRSMLMKLGCQNGRSYTTSQDHLHGFSPLHCLLSTLLISRTFVPGCQTSFHVHFLQVCDIQEQSGEKRDWKEKCVVYLNTLGTVAYLFEERSSFLHYFRHITCHYCFSVIGGLLSDYTIRE